MESSGQTQSPFNNGNTGHGERGYDRVIAADGEGASSMKQCLMKLQKALSLIDLNFQQAEPRHNSGLQGLATARCQTKGILPGPGIRSKPVLCFFLQHILFRYRPHKPSPPPRSFMAHASGTHSDAIFHVYRANPKNGNPSLNRFHPPDCMPSQMYTNES